MKFNKNNKFNIANLPINKTKNHLLFFGNFGIKSLTVGLISPKHLENLRRKLSKQLKRINNLNKSKLFIRVNLWKAFTCKPMLSRMGKGAGAINKWMTLIRPGFILIELLSSEAKIVIANIVKRAVSSFPKKYC